MLDALAVLLAYPGGAFLSCNGDVAPAFTAALAALSPAEREELYARTFDLDPDATLEIGWHLFGEEYARGEFLVWLRAELRRLELDPGTELPDHLANVLRVLARLEPERATRFADACVAPAVQVLREAVAADNPYQLLLSALAEQLRILFPLAAETPSPAPAGEGRGGGRPSTTPVQPAPLPPPPAPQGEGPEGGATHATCHPEEVPAHG